MARRSVSKMEALFGVDEEEEEGDPTWKSNFIPRRVKGRADELDLPAHVKERVAYKFTRNAYLKVAINVVILLNAIQMGLAADIQDEPWDDIWNVCDHFFTVVFAAEMVLHIVAIRLYYFTDGWNWLDFFVANIAILDTWILPFVIDGNSSIGAFRVFRLLRLLRMVKVMHVVPELMVVVEGIVASLKSMFWIFMLLLIVLYATSICCVEVIGGKSSAYPGMASSDIEIEKKVVNDFNSYMFFGTVARSMVSLFNVVLLAEWPDVIRPVFEKQVYMVLFFVMLVIVCAFGILNVIIGVVVEKTTESMNQIRQSHIVALKKKQMQQVRCLASLMFSLDVDMDQRISREELEQGVTNDDLQKLFDDIDLPSGFNFSELFAMLDVDGSGFLSKGEFVDGIMRLIYNTEFHRDCLVQVAFGHIKHSTSQMHSEMKALHEEMHQEIMNEVRAFRENLYASYGKSSKESEERMLNTIEERTIEERMHPSEDTLQLHMDARGLLHGDSLLDLTPAAGAVIEATAQPQPKGTPFFFGFCSQCTSGAPIEEKMQSPMPNPQQNPAGPTASRQDSSAWQPMEVPMIRVKYSAGNQHSRSVGPNDDNPATLQANQSDLVQPDSQKVVGFLPVVCSPARSIEATSAERQRPVMMSTEKQYPQDCDGHRTVL